MRTTNRHWMVITFIFIIFIQVCCPYPSEANSAEPPSLIILVDDPFRTMTMTLYDDTRVIQPSVYETLWERKFSFHQLYRSKQQQFTLSIKTPEKSYTLQIPRLTQRYRTLYKFNPGSGELEKDLPIWRNGVLTAIRLTSTLLIEGAVFYFLGFRNKNSWMMFLLINLVTQGALNLWLNSLGYMEGYLILALVFGELFVFGTEVLAYAIYIEEKSVLRRVGAALLVNAVSLVLGGYLILNLPLPI